MIAFLLIFILTVASGLQAQQAPGTSKTAPRTKAETTKKQEPAQTGMANGGLQKAVFDDQHRPMIAGGIVKSGPIVFKNVAEAAGLTRWHHTAGSHVKRLLLEAKGPGVCLIDYD